MAILTREAILNAPLLQRPFHVKQWDGEVVVGEIPVGKRRELLARMLDKQGKVQVNPEIELDLFIAGVLEPEFTRADAEALQRVSGAAVSEVAAEVLRVNNLVGSEGADMDAARGES